jgi:DNA-binding CsgD family transcriptional regulator/PAS domain-containing protein
LASHSSPHRRLTSTSPAAGLPEEDGALVAALLHADQLQVHLPIGLLVYDAKSLEIVHANPMLLRFIDPDLMLDEVVGSPNGAHDPQFRDSELASALVEVAASGAPRHLREFRHDFLGRGPRWWSASLHRIDTVRWGRVVVTLAVDLTDQVRARHLLEDREERRLLLQQAIASVPGQDLMSSLQRVADALVTAFPVDAAALRLLDSDAKLHLIAATGLRPDEIRRLAFEPVTIRRLEAISEGGRHPLVGSLGLRWVEIRWLRVRDERIGALTVGARRDRRLSKDDFALLEVAAEQLGDGLERIERSPGFLRNRSLELARSSAEDDEAGIAGVGDLRPRELAILRLYAEGLETNQIAELLVLSVHTVRTHVK